MTWAVINFTSIESLNAPTTVATHNNTQNFVESLRISVIFGHSLIYDPLKIRTSH